MLTPKEMYKFDGFIDSHGKELNACHFKNFMIGSFECRCCNYNYYWNRKSTLLGKEYIEVICKHPKK